MRILAPLVVLIVAIAIVGPQTFYTVDETQYVVITRFGEVQRVIQSPGLNVKAPFIDQVNVIDSRILRVDVPPSSMPDVENQFLDIDAYARYRIIDPRSFREVLLNEINAASRISNIVVAELRAEIGQRNRTEIIGGRLAAGAARRRVRRRAHRRGRRRCNARGDYAPRARSLGLRWCRARRSASRYWTCASSAPTSPRRPRRACSRACGRSGRCKRSGYGQRARRNS